MSDILYQCAKEFEKISEYNYLFTVGKNKKQFQVTLNFMREEFTHIVGLDHLNDIESFDIHNLKIKLSTFEKILSKEITYEDIKKSESFSAGFPCTYNSLTMQEYTLTDRLQRLLDIERILDGGFAGCLYK